MKAFSTFSTAACMALMVIGCAQRPIKLATPCTTHSTTDLIASLTSMVVAEGMSVTLVNETVGILQASTAEETSILTGTTTNQWIFTVKDGRVEAYAKTLNQTRNQYGATISSHETYSNDEAKESWKWYWNVRNGLQRLCGDTIRFIEQ